MYLSVKSDDIQEKEIGKYSNSKYKSTVSQSFSKSKRPGMENQNMLYTPGFKYRSFSEFGSLSWFSPSYNLYATKHYNYISYQKEQMQETLNAKIVVVGDGAIGKTCVMIR